MAGEQKPESAERAAVANQAMTHLDHLYRVAFHLARDAAEADDLVQETYVRALDAHDQFTAGTNMKAWLARILRNVFFDRYRQRKREVAAEEIELPEEAPDPGQTPESQVLRGELDEQITRVLRTIPDEFRLPIVLVDLGGFSYEQVASILSCPIGTVRSRLSRGRKLLRESLSHYLGGSSKKATVMK